MRARAHARACAAVCQVAPLPGRWPHVPNSRPPPGPRPRWSAAARPWPRAPSSLEGGAWWVAGGWLVVGGLVVCGWWVGGLVGVLVACWIPELGRPVSGCLLRIWQSGKTYPTPVGVLFGMGNLAPSGGSNLPDVEPNWIGTISPSKRPMKRLDHN